MDDQNIARLEQLLQETHELIEENNELLRSLDQRAKLAFWGKLILWLVVLGLPILFLGPLLHSLLPNPSGSTGVFGLPSQDQLNDLVNEYQSL
jgi:hypothetical protein